MAVVSITGDAAVALFEHAPGGVTTPMLQFHRRRAASAAIALAIGAAASLTTPASAAPVSYDFSFTQTATPEPLSLGNFSGRFSVENNIIIDISGSGAVIGTITGLLPVGPFNDNAFSATAPYLSSLGILFSSSNFNSLHLKSTPFDEYRVDDDWLSASLGTLAVTRVAVTQVPEPGALGLTALALAAAAAAGRRGARRRVAAAG